MRFRTTAPPAIRPSATINLPPAVIPGATNTVQGPPCTLTPDRRIWPAGEAAFFLMRAASHREAMPPFCSAALDHLLAIRRTHALQESVRSSALAAIRLIGSLHGYSSFKTVKRLLYVSRLAMSSIGLRLASFLFAHSHLTTSLLGLLLLDSWEDFLIPHPPRRGPTLSPRQPPQTSALIAIRLHPHPSHKIEMRSPPIYSSILW